MAAVSVFVDDAIRGNLPLVCAKTGEPADLVIRMHQPVGGGSLGLLWLLVLLGPPGWVAVVLLSVCIPGPEVLTVRIPQSQAAYDRRKFLERRRLAAFAAGVLLIALYGFVRPVMFPALWLLTAAALLVAGIVLHTMVERQQIGVSIDASRRWVTFSNVHRAFVEAVEQAQLVH
jgi:hypothetical protein